MLLEHIAMDVPEVKTEELGLASSRVQPLLFYCQRGMSAYLSTVGRHLTSVPPGFPDSVAASHLDGTCLLLLPLLVVSHVAFSAIDSFAGLPFELVAPILESCTAQQLLRFEEDAPVRHCAYS